MNWGMNMDSTQGESDPKYLGEGLSRLSGLTDGVFAIALTLMALEIRVPEGAGTKSEAGLFEALEGLLPQLLVYALSFLTLAIFWFGQQTQHRLMNGADRRLATLHLCFLALIGLLPFSTGLLADHIGLRLPIAIYWLHLFLLGTLLFLSWRYAEKHRMIEQGIDQKAVYRRIIRAQILWGLGAALCLVSIGVSICFLMLVQILYAADVRATWIRKVMG